MPLDRKLAVVDLTTGEIEIKTIPLEVRKKFLGGRGLAAYLLLNYTPKGCDPYGPDNAVIVSGGILKTWRWVRTTADNCLPGSWYWKPL